MKDLDISHATDQSILTQPMIEYMHTETFGTKTNYMGGMGGSIYGFLKMDQLTAFFTNDRVIPCCICPLQNSLLLPM